MLCDSHPELMEAHPHSYLISYEEGPYVRHRLECLKVKIEKRVRVRVRVNMKERVKIEIVKCTLRLRQASRIKLSSML